MDKIPFGQFKNKTVKSLIMKELDYIAWILRQESPSGPLVALKDEIIRLIKIFDSKPLQRVCCVCSAEAKYCAVAQKSVIDPIWYCNECDPFDNVLIESDLDYIKSYRDAIEHCKGYRVDKKSALMFIRAIAKAKGLGKRLTEKELDKFFQ